MIKAHNRIKRENRDHVRDEDAANAATPLGRNSMGVKRTRTHIIIELDRSAKCSHTGISSFRLQQISVYFSIDEQEFEFRKGDGSLYFFESMKKTVWEKGEDETESGKPEL